MVVDVGGKCGEELNKNNAGKQMAGSHVMMAAKVSSDLLGSFRHRHRPSNSTISSQLREEATPSTHFIHTRPHATSILPIPLVSVSKDQYGRQDGRRRGRLSSCRQRSYRRAAFTMYLTPSHMISLIADIHTSHNRQLCPSRPSSCSLRWTLHPPCTPLNIEHAQEPSAPRRPLDRRCFAVRLTPRLARQAFPGVCSPKDSICSCQRQCIQGRRCPSRIIHLPGCPDPGTSLPTTLSVAMPLTFPIRSTSTMRKNTHTVPSSHLLWSTEYESTTAAHWTRSPQSPTSITTSSTSSSTLSRHLSNRPSLPRD